MTIMPKANQVRGAAKPPQKNAIPWKLTEPRYRFSDLILDAGTTSQLRDVVGFYQHQDLILDTWGLSERCADKCGLAANLYGEPGTGKTMAAHAIANALHKQMICVNYADIESKYVGETSKNLTALFSYARSQNVIIFFDEADALLSKRVTNMSHSTDVSVNQTRSVLLTLLNDYDGMVLFATNFISNYDAAFMRRIQYHVKFELPTAELRKKLWRMYIPVQMPAVISIDDIAEKFDGISGSDISNAVLKAALKSAARDEDTIPQLYFEEAVQEIIDSKKANDKSKGSDVVIAKSEMVPPEAVPPEIRNKT